MLNSGEYRGLASHNVPVGTLFSFAKSLADPLDRGGERSPSGLAVMTRTIAATNLEIANARPNLEALGQRSGHYLNVGLRASEAPMDCTNWLHAFAARRRSRIGDHTPANAGA